QTAQASIEASTPLPNTLIDLKPAKCAYTSPINIRDSANAILGVMAYAVTPDVNTSSLSVRHAETDNPSINMSQLGGGATLSKEVPIYLEGTLSYSRYDPRFILSNGAETRRLPTKWINTTATGGVGYDFQLNEKWVFRPIANFSLGRVTSDVSVGKWYLENKFDIDLPLDFLDKGHLNVYGYGGSAMLDYEHFGDFSQREGDIDVELRYTNIRLKTYTASAIALEGATHSETANLWARYRAPLFNLHAFNRPIRYVLESGYTHYFGKQKETLGFDQLASMGLGLEVDTSANDFLISRTRLVGRYALGNGVSGGGVSLACSF
ncbi:MAG: autotransporter outer membrane beta-barrel domain-containing protein, partial [Neisseriaceae bacterium]|nr:autotransporter outer membrane beta-barrel domain-containing protein [Neisseriaceae bacterium]